MTDYRAVAQSITNVKLGYNDIVHHINGDRQDNSPDNLMVMSRANHMKLHNDPNKHVIGIDAEDLSNPETRGKLCHDCSDGIKRTLYASYVRIQRRVNGKVKGKWIRIGYYCPICGFRPTITPEQTAIIEGF